jgi:hypothetical protein
VLLFSIFRGYTGDEKKKIGTSLIATSFSNGSNPPGTSIQEEIFELPTDIAYSNEQFCDILQVSYYLEFDAGRCKAEIPIIITAVPLRFDNTN